MTPVCMLRLQYELFNLEITNCALYDANKVARVDTRNHIYLDAVYHKISSTLDEPYT